MVIAMHKRRGFTLIELLVVIAIIALLMAILMPALQRVKKQARTVYCLNSLKQLGMAMTMYADDNGGFIPRALDHNVKWIRLALIVSGSRNWGFELKNGFGFWGRGFIAGERFEHTTTPY